MIPKFCTNKGSSFISRHFFTIFMRPVLFSKLRKFQRIFVCFYSQRVMILIFMFNLHFLLENKFKCALRELHTSRITQKSELSRVMKTIVAFCRAYRRLFQLINTDIEIEAVSMTKSLSYRAGLVWPAATRAVEAVVRLICLLPATLVETNHRRNFWVLTSESDWRRWSFSGKPPWILRWNAFSKSWVVNLQFVENTVNTLKVSLHILKVASFLFVSSARNKTF